MPYLEMVPPVRQKSWQWMAVANFALGGTGSGLFLLGTLFVCIDSTWMTGPHYFLLKVLSLLMVCLGFFCVFLEAGKPFRGYRLFSSLPHSWMSIEGLFGAIFILFAASGLSFDSFFVHSVAVISAMMLMVSQAFMVVSSVAVKAWNEKRVLFVFIGSGFMSAGGLILLMLANAAFQNRLLLMLILAIVLVNLTVWLIYLFRKVESDFKAAVKHLRHPVSLILVVGIGHLAPFLLLCFLLTGGVDPFSWAALSMGAASGLMLVAGGISQKIGVVIAAGYYRRIVLKKEFVQR